MGRLHILPQGYHWMEFGHEDRDLHIIGGIIAGILFAAMLILSYYIH